MRILTWLVAIGLGPILLTANPATANPLLAAKTDSAPVIDGAVDAVWSSAEAINIQTWVPEYKATDADHPDKWWDGYEGQKIPVKIKTLYTDERIYFLVRWRDATASYDRQSWYFEPGANRWLQKPKYTPSDYDRPPAYEDKFTFFWNMTISDFKTEGCAALCHGTRMRTIRDNERADIWHWKLDRGGPVGIIDDKWLNNDENGRHGDPGQPTYSSNSQTLQTDSGEVKAPLHWIPDRMNYHWILQSEIDAGIAKRIVGMDSDGNLVDEDGTVLNKEKYGHDSAWTLPSLTRIQPGSGSRADVREAHTWADGVWTLEIVRNRDTGDPEHDVQFTGTGIPYEFSIGVMDAAAIAHATPGGFDGDVFELILAE